MLATRHCFQTSVNVKTVAIKHGDLFDGFLLVEWRCSGVKAQLIKSYLWATKWSVNCFALVSESHLSCCCLESFILLISTGLKITLLSPTILYPSLAFLVDVLPGSFPSYGQKGMIVYPHRIFIFNISLLPFLQGAQGRVCSYFLPHNNPVR